MTDESDLLQARKLPQRHLRQGPAALPATTSGANSKTAPRQTWPCHAASEVQPPLRHSSRLKRSLPLKRQNDPSPYATLALTRLVGFSPPSALACTTNSTPKHGSTHGDTTPPPTRGCPSATTPYCTTHTRPLCAYAAASNGSPTQPTHNCNPINRTCVRTWRAPSCAPPPPPPSPGPPRLRRENKMCSAGVGAGVSAGLGAGAGTPGA